MGRVGGAALLALVLLVLVAGGLAASAPPYAPSSAENGITARPGAPESIDADGTTILATRAQPLTRTPADATLVARLVGDAQVVLIGEATHGTREFYRTRAEITKHLIQHEGFQAVAIEGDWPDADRAHRYAVGTGSDATPEEALGAFTDFPVWMWRNADVRDFVSWLRGHNERRPREERVGFYGMDLYSVYPSMRAVETYLDRVDPAAAQRARDRYACFGSGSDTIAYGQRAHAGEKARCDDEAVAQLRELEEAAARYAGSPRSAAAEEAFSAVRNAHVVVDGERYFRGLYGSDEPTWNIRDSHMISTVAAIREHLEARGLPPKIVLWAHNSHVGDARATQMGEGGEHNIGQLSRERWGSDAFLIGFSTYTGTVAAALEWDQPPKLQDVLPGADESYEELMHEIGRAATPDFLLDLKDPVVVGALPKERIQRAIGVLYLQATERWSHYFDTRLAEQFDVLLHYDTTRAVDPLDRIEGFPPPPALLPMTSTEGP